MRSGLTTIQNTEELQVSIVNWVRLCQPVLYGNLKKSFMKLVQKEAALSVSEIDSNAFYDLVFPLIQIGVLEYEVNLNGNTVLFFPEDNSKIRRRPERLDRFDICEECCDMLSQDGLSLLCSLPSINKYIDNLEISYGHDLKYRANDYNFKLELLDPKKGMPPGVYKEKDYPFYPFYLVDCNGVSRRIFPYQQSFECMFYARCYSRINNGVKLYEARGDELELLSPGIIPPFIYRALVMLDCSVLKTEEAYLGKQKEYRHMTSLAINEIDRIFERSRR